MTDFLLTFPQICFSNGNEFFYQHDSVSVIGNQSPPEKMFVCNLVDISAPEKKKAPPPKFPQFAADTLPAPQRPCPFWDFQLKTDPPPPGASDSPFPLPEQKKMKISETSTKVINLDTTVEICPEFFKVPECGSEFL